MTLKNLIFLLLTMSIHFEGASAGFEQERPKQKLKLNQSASPTSNFSSNNRYQNTASKRVDELADKIISTLELDDSDSKTIHFLCEERSEKIEKIRLNNSNNQQKIFDLQTVNQDFDKKIKQLVTASQFQKYEALRRAGN